MVVAVRGDEPDHHAYRGLASLRYAATQRGRVAGGWAQLAGNHVMVQVPHGPVVALCHLRQGSLRVRVGDSVRVGEPLGQCGNSGNSTEPHVHLQAIDRADAGHAGPVPITFGGHLPRNGEVVEAP
jgi:murein DD-endopeptidase MepM/ murein hydrolase activator NlpD